MSSENPVEEQKAANLARIRDNQRRSRARRKEYLQELEERYRICEQVGVEASAEMQTAARRVIEENRFLRSLLKQHGYSDADLDRMNHDGTSAIPPVSNLEGLFGQRKSCTTTREQAGSLVLSSSESSSQHTTPLNTTMAQQHSIQSAPAQHYSQVYTSPYAAVEMNVQIGGPSSVANGLAYGEQRQWTNDYHAASYMRQPDGRGHILPPPPRAGHPYEVPSIQSIKAEIGYGPEEELDDDHNADVEYAMSDEQAYDLSKRFPR